MHARPSLLLDFLNDYGYIDPRIVFTRAGVATYCDRNGILRTRSSNNPRFVFHQITGNPMGLFGEFGATNLLTFSEDFSNANWIKSVVTVTANTAVAPDGNTAADTITATGASPYVTQPNITIVAGNTVVFSVFAQKAATNFVYINVTDAGNSPIAWFNLATGVVSSHTGGSGTCVYGASYIEPWANGWYRCTLVVTTNTTTTVQAGIHPTSADGNVGANGDAVNVWGAMLSAAAAPGGGAAFAKATSYLAAPAGSQVTRGNENVLINLPDPTWFDPTQGTLFADFSIPIGNGQNTLFVVGSGNTPSDYMGIQIQVGGTFGPGGNNNIWGSIIAGGAQQSQPVDNNAITAPDTPIRAAMGYKQGDYTTLCVNGRTVQQSNFVPAAWPATPVRFSLGWPWTTALGNIDTRRIAYFPRKLTNAQLQKLTT